MKILTKGNPIEYKEVKVISNNNLQGDYYLLKVEAVNPERQPLPGQFYQVKPLTVNGRVFDSGRILFKPLSIYNFDGRALCFLLKVIGTGTYELSSMVKDDILAVYGPLGNSFVSSDTFYSEKKLAVLISGGIGYAPLYYLHRKLSEAGTAHHWLHGGRTAADLFQADYICTDDGAKGDKGLVTDCLDGFFSARQNQISRVFCCGPKPMMKKVHLIAQSYNISALFSLEEYMACGIGVCLGCAVRKSKCTCNENPYMMVCKDGPVFDGKEVDWNE